MLNYYEVMTTDLGLLTTAAGKWDDMAGELKKVETRYGDSVQKITMGQNWQGLSAGTAHTSFAATRYEYSAAQIQAKAIASLLREAHEKFTDLKKKLESARDDAIAAGMTVSEQGRVAFDYSKLTPSERSAYHHDPDGQKTISEAVTKWQQHIDDRVKAVTELDQNVKTALQGAVVDSNKDALGKGNDETLDGFNAGAQGEIAKAPKPSESAIRTKPDGYTFTGPDAGFGLSGTKYGKEGSAKAYAELFHFTAKGEATKGGINFSGIDDWHLGARAQANYGLTNKGLSGKAEVSAGLRALLEGRAQKGYGEVYGRGEIFVGGEAAATLGVGKDGFTAGAKAFAGEKVGVAGGGELAGLGAGGTAEAWYGAGAEAKATFGKGEDGKWHIGGEVGLALGIGGSVGAEFTVDTEKVGKAFDDAADAVGDFAGGVKNTVGSWID
ncbi:hypothetical protein [Streptomyces sp. NBC_00091]|uniref:hypothetical protein n=1 Tax=Streptomyces sp. NBC_00091 TaxID=2975648 RepID=UPI00224F822F|nr:hypothetical protein [Streptomyces sp. NBC_00091]MCX5376210.1 hypothetical protein [Streptomyces sp. NBC_00091]